MCAVYGERVLKLSWYVVMDAYLVHLYIVVVCGSVHCVCIGGIPWCVTVRSMDTLETKSEPGTYVVYTLVCGYYLWCVSDMVVVHVVCVVWCGVLRIVYCGVDSVRDMLWMVVWFMMCWQCVLMVRKYVVWCGYHVWMVRVYGGWLNV